MTDHYGRVHVFTGFYGIQQAYTWVSAWTGPGRFASGAVAPVHNKSAAAGQLAESARAHASIESRKAHVKA